MGEERVQYEWAIFGPTKQTACGFGTGLDPARWPYNVVQAFATSQFGPNVYVARRPIVCNPNIVKLYC